MLRCHHASVDRILTLLGEVTETVRRGCRQSRVDYVAERLPSEDEVQYLRWLAEDQDLALCLVVRYSRWSFPKSPAKRQLHGERTVAFDRHTVWFYRGGSQTR